MTVEAALKQARDAIYNSGVSHTPSLDAQVLLASILSCERAVLFTHSERILTNDEKQLFDAAIERRLSGRAVAYETGTKEFFGISFMVTPAVLIPKSDTETLIEKALDAICVVTSTTPVRIIDACTGSGCVAVSLAYALSKSGIAPHLYTIMAVDILPEAVHLAALNAQHILSPETASRLSFYTVDVCADMTGILGIEPESVDVIVSNPPYVPTAMAQALLKDGRGEPLLALDGGSEGLDIICQLSAQSYTLLKKGGRIYIETGEYNANATRQILAQHGFIDILTHRDISESERVTEGTK